MFTPRSSASSKWSENWKRKASLTSAAAAAVRNMSSRIIRGDNRLKKLNVSSLAEGTIIGGSEEHVMDVEKQAFEQGYAKGERIGKEMGEKMVETVVKRYDNSIVQLAESHKAVMETIEEQTVRLALEMARKVVQRG